MTSAEDRDHARTVDVLWGRRVPSTRGPKAAFSREDVIETAIAAADREGLAAVSMKRLADELGFTKMALYRHVPGKQQLVAAMIDTAAGAPPGRGEFHGGWRDQLTRWAYLMFDVFWQHQWLLQAAVGPRVMGPNELAWLDRAVAALGGTGFEGYEKLDAAVVVIGHIRSVAEQSGTSASGSPVTRRQFMAPMIELMGAHGERFPAVASALAGLSPNDSQGDALQFGLDCILDGLAVRISRRGAGA